MGVPGLWKILDTVAQDLSLEQYSLEEGFQQRRHGHRLVKIGVDASIWIRRCQGKFSNASHHFNAGENPELRTLFFKLCHLLKTCTLPIFVFDGPSRPSVKRGKAVRHAPSWIEGRFKLLIEAFGFYCHQAPGEAEAELAQLNAAGIIDAVLTDDSDAFLFGATHVIRSRPESKDPNEVTMYTRDAIESDHHLQLSPESLILIGVLAGGDYDQTGLRNCGIELANIIARNTHLGEQLVRMFKTYRHKANQLDYSLRSWRNELRKVIALYKDLLKQQFKTIGQISVGEAFPSVTAVDQYVNPVTSCDDNVAAGPDASCWIPRIPDLNRLSGLCERCFNWGTQKGIEGMFRKHVWPGTCVRALLEVRQIHTKLQH
ncbi:PIN domain-like protein [Amanita muscaria]